MSFVPSSRPKQLREDSVRMLAQLKVTDAVALLGIRGYYDASGNNQVGIYDDAIFLVSPDVYLAFNANTDPTRFSVPYRQEGMATLQPGIWKYRLGIHGLSHPKAQQYEALVQADQVTVDRYQQQPETGFFGINIHHGSYDSTSSEGCQTIYPEQWAEFHDNVKQQLSLHKQTIIPYALVVQK